MADFSEETRDTSSPRPATPNNGREWIVFNAKGDDFRAARSQCALACESYNSLPENIPPAIRACVFLDIFDPDHPLDNVEAPYVKPPFYMDYGLRVSIHPSTFINRGCKILDTPVADITIGKRGLIGPDVNIMSVSHPMNPDERGTPNPSCGKGVTIGDDVWICAAAQICPGVTIGDGAVVLVGAVVTKDVPPYCAVSGNPAKVVQENLELKDWISRDGMIWSLEEALKIGVRGNTEHEG